MTSFNLTSLLICLSKFPPLEYPPCLSVVSTNCSHANPQKLSPSCNFLPVRQKRNYPQWQASYMDDSPSSAFNKCPNGASYPVTHNCPSCSSKTDERSSNIRIAYIIFAPHSTLSFSNHRNKSWRTQTSKLTVTNITSPLSIARHVHPPLWIVSQHINQFVTIRIRVWVLQLLHHLIYGYIDH